MEGCWFVFIKSMLYISSIMILIVSVLFMGLVMWMMYDENTFLVSFAEEQQDYQVALYLGLVVGIILVIAAILGCCGTYKKSRPNVMVAFCTMLVILVWKIAFGTWVAVNCDRLKDILKSNMINTIKNEYSVIESRTMVVDAFQYELECCGLNGPADWAGSKYANKDPSLPFNLTVSSGVTNTYSVPESCCKIPDRNVCNDTRQMKIGGTISSAIYDEGCMDKLTVILSKQTNIIGIIMIGITLLEFLFVCICVIYMQLLTKERYKS